MVPESISSVPTGVKRVSLPFDAPFVSICLIQRLVTSNPSPRYIQEVSVAFSEGFYEFDGVIYGTGKYGDMASTIAAILLDREARDVVLDQDASHGALRLAYIEVSFSYAEYGVCFTESSTYC